MFAQSFLHLHVDQLENGSKGRARLALINTLKPFADRSTPKVMLLILSWRDLSSFS